jgi:hypothetical protein
MSKEKNELNKNKKNNYEIAECTFNPKINGE